MPLTACGLVVVMRGYKLLVLFLIFAVIGTALEWLAGFVYQRVIGKRLWTYHRYRIGPYTSWQSAPMWGMGAVLFWLVVKIWA